MKISALFSGSSGNCIYIETEENSFLVDAGLSGKKIEKALNAINRKAENIKGIFVTHEHTDHINAVGILARRYNIPIYISKETYRMSKKKLGKVNSIHFFDPSDKLKFSDIVVEPFSIMHDAIEPVGYNFYSKQKKFCIATDIGYVDLLAKSKLKNCNIILLETNYEPNVLLSDKCSYPWSVKQRIRSRRGHLSNNEAFKLLNEIRSEKLHTVILGHLSKESNSYDIVEKLAYNWAKNKNIKTIIAKQDSSTELVEV